MPELYHAKKKKPVIETLDTVSGAGKKIRSFGDRAHDSIKTNKTAIYKGPKKPENTSPVSNMGATIGKVANSAATTAKATKSLGVSYKKPADEKDEGNEPKKLRKRLNKYQLKNIVGPKR